MGRSRDRAAVVASLLATTLTAASARLSAQPPEAPLAPCLSWTAEAQYRNYGYDHVVRFDNRCSSEARCTVTTDVNPEPMDITIAPGSLADLLTFRGSPASTFVPRVLCRLAR